MVAHIVSVQDEEVAQQHIVERKVGHLHGLKERVTSCGMGLS